MLNVVGHVTVNVCRLYGRVSAVLVLLLDYEYACVRTRKLWVVADINAFGVKDRFVGMRKNLVLQELYMLFESLLVRKKIGILLDDGLNFRR